MDIYERFYDSMENVYNLSDKTLKVYRINLKEFNQYVFGDKIATIEDIKKLTSDDIMLKCLKKKEAENISPAGLNQRKATLSRFYTYYMGLQMLSVNIPKTINGFKINSKEKDILTLEESKELLNSVAKLAKDKPTYKNIRNEFMINLFLGCGLRIEELCEIRVSDFDIENKKLHVHIAKFGKPRKVSLPQSVINSFIKHIKSRDKKYPNLNEEQKDIVFISQKKNTLSTDQARETVNNLLEKFNLPRVTPHALRHAFGTLLLATGKVTLSELSKEMGHNDISTTQKWYIHQTDDKDLGELNPLFN